ncbi:D-alanyl-D-alanine carboxypeptidase family protein [Ruminococcus sp.]|uniref:D-alanyl-D-alanine carboxypeptidase family protein n=1 Tax=Ruminococcus sp. TaxID=41978 RepID=UPI001B5DCEE0|nr:D-alanyl-D-alanine carboxypeptidase family protein [Ruminococcus sp.]MBP5432563.1 D-alanyl-D-alanine carboxypeptidase family protein [Ruminococcus sp.]
MRAKRIIANVLSFALCACSVSAASASAADSSTNTAPQNSSDNETTVVSTAAATSETAQTDDSESVITIKLGDVNGDDYIDAADASKVLSAYSKTSSGLSSGLSTKQTIAADVNMDGIIDAVDASSILSYYAYISTAVTVPRSIESYLKNMSEPKTTTAATTNVVTTTAAAATTSAASTVSTTLTTDSATTSTAPISTTATATTSEAAASSVTVSVTAEASTNVSVTGTTTAPATSADTTLSLTTVVTTETTTAITTDPNKVSAIKLSKTEISLNVGEGDISMVTMLPATADKTEKWKSSDESIATVNFEGWISAVSEGICTVTVQSASNPEITADIKVTVTDPTRVRELKLNKSEMIIPTGGQDLALVSMLPANAVNKGEIWISSDEDVATVSKEGLISGIAPGSCTVTVISKSNPDVKAEIKVKVTDPKQPLGIKLTKYEMDILAGTLDISFVNTLPDTAVPITEVWVSSDPGVASVDRWGNVYGVSEGSCIITVSSMDNPDIRADIQVKVHSKPVTTTTTTATTTTTSTTTTITTTATTSTYTVSDTSTAKTTTVSTTSAPVVSTAAEHLIQVHDGVTYIDGILIVNKTYSLPKDFAPGELSENTAENFVRLSSDARELGLNIVCTSGYRSYESQEQIYNNYAAADGVLKADTYSARAGHSEHQTGLAIDVNSISDDFIGTPECEWLAQNAHMYGFIIRYPKGKEEYTGFSYEPWHIRYVGEDTATKIYESGLSLEEYLGIDSCYR